MSSSISFVGAGFYVAGASQYTPGTVRVRFSSTPIASNPANANDALNPTNYALSGPGPYSLGSIQSVSGDPLSYDLVLGAPLVVGTWTVTVSNVTTPSASPLTAPTSAQFQVTTASTLTPLSGGAENDDPERIIRKHLSPALKGPNWDALIKALSTGDDKNWTNAESAFDQLFKSSASGSYLERRAADDGVRRPINVGISDELFRRLAIKTTTKKVVHQAIREILEVFYGQDSLRAFAECTLDEPYNLTGEPVLTWKLDERDEFSHTFKSAEFGSAATAKAQEIAFALTKTMQDQGSMGFAVAYRSSETGLYRVRIYSGSLGLGSFARVTGGSAQNLLKFPTEITTYSGTVTTGTGYSWVYSQPDSNTTRISLTAPGVGILVSLASVQEGDYVIIGQDAQTGVTGTYVVKAVSISWSGANLTQYFDIERISYTGSATQASNDAYRFYRPTKNSTSATSGRTVVVAQTVPGKLDISIPATTQAVTRTPETAAYLRSQDEMEIARLQRRPDGTVTISTKAGHGYTSGDVGKFIQLDGIKPAAVRPFVTPNNGASIPSTWSFAASHVSISAETQEAYNGVYEKGTATLLSNGQVLFTGGFLWSGSAYSGSVAFCERYQSVAGSTVIDGTEADGATQHAHQWITTSDLNGHRQYHAASTYGPGAIVTGGMRLSPYTILSSAERYQLDGSWTTIGSLLTARAGHSQIELNNGNVMVMGGASTEGTALRSTEIYNGVSWAAGPTMITPRTDFQAVKLSSGNVVVLGGRTMGRGHDPDDNTLALWKLDEATGPTANDTKTIYPLTFTNAPTVSTQGKINNCLDFNPANSHLTGAGNADAVTALTGEWSLELWFKRSTSAAGQLVVYAGATEVSNDNTLLKLGIDGSEKLYWKWENGAGVDVTQTMTLALTSLPAYRPSFFNHVAMVKSLNGLNYSGKTSGWAVGDLIHGMTSGAKAYVVSVDGGAPGGASGVVRVRTANHLNFTSGENLVIIPINNLALTPSFLSTAAVCGTSLYDVTLYLNGVAYQTWTDQANSTGGSAAAWYVARDPKIGGSTFPGFIDDIRVSKKARDSAEVRQSYLNGWGNHQSPHGDIAIGALTAECEVYNGSTWAALPPMGMARAYHRAVVLPGDYILVTGGVGYNPSQLLGYSDTDTSYWPSQSLREAELFDPNSNQWRFIQPSGVRRHGHVMAYLPTRNEVVLIGGRSRLLNSIAADDTKYIDILDLTTKTWKTAPAKLLNSRELIAGAVSGSEVVVGGGNNGISTYLIPEAYLPGGQAVSSGGLNGQFKITAVPDGNTLQVQSTTAADQKQYTSTMGSTYLAPNDTLGYWNISSGSRISNVTTLSLSFPSGISGHGIAVGDYVYVNSLTAGFSAGLKLVIGASSTDISYAETAGNMASTPVVGSVSENQSGTPVGTLVSAPAADTAAPGPTILDPDSGLSITDTEGITTVEYSAGQQNEELEISNGTSFPDEEHFIVLGFGYSTQSKPIKVLGKYQSGGNTRLILDYSYRFEFNYPIGTKVTLLAGRESFIPADADDQPVTWLTAASAGRVAAQAAAEEALAAGIDPDVVIVYPGDRGLGGEGLPAMSTQKLSDKVAVFAGDEVEEEVQARRDE